MKSACLSGDAEGQRARAVDEVLLAESEEVAAVGALGGGGEAEQELGAEARDLANVHADVEAVGVVAAHQEVPGAVDGRDDGRPLLFGGVEPGRWRPGPPRACLD